MPQTSTHLELGYVARAHGLRGELGVKTFDPASESLFQVDRVVLRSKAGVIRELALDAVRAGTKELLVRLAGIEGRTEAESLVGSTLLVFREDLPPLDEGEYFLGDLVGLKALDEGGRSVGTVEGVMDSGPVPNLVIRTPNQEERLIPFVEDFVGTVDLVAGTITVRPLEWDEA